MTLTPSSTAAHNRMLGLKVPHPKSTNFTESSERSPKRRKVESPKDSSKKGSISKLKGFERKAPVESEDENDVVIKDEPPPSSQTDLESALPQIKVDAEAIEEYETLKAAEQVSGETHASRLNDRKWIRGKSSIYVDAFNLALDTVLEEESHLFDEAERALFQQWSQLSYAAQYLYVRLFLRKTSAWHRINTLGYHSDIADMDEAIIELQQLHDIPKPEEEPQKNPGELEPPPGTTLGSSFTFADKSEDHIDTLDEASSLLKLDELKALAKDARVQGKTKRELLKNFRRASRQQSGIVAKFRRSDTNESLRSMDSESDAFSRGPTPREATPVATPTATPREATPSVYDDDDPIDENRDSHFLKKIMGETGPCIRLTLAPVKLFERVHLVFYRSTEWTEKSLTTIILARIAKRNFPEYIVSRSACIFESRALLVEFEAALRTQFRVDSIMEFNGPPSADGLQFVLDLYEEVYPRWCVILKDEMRKEERVYQSGEGAYLRRLSPAWVYTRVIHKAAYIFGKQKQHKREHQLLTELLEQRLFHHARRGYWYDRKALLEEHYMANIEPLDGRSVDSQKKHWRRIALMTCEDALQDPLVHVIYHYDIQKRLRKLEKALIIPKRLQHDFSHVRLALPLEVYIEGTQVIRETPRLNRRNSSPHPSKPLRGGKTIWLDPLEGDGECSVEAMCLSHYRTLGWKGFHSEGGIVRTLFAYLFYDVVFTYIPNVFQSPFQTCPLDLHTDAFYPSRLSEINARLNKISNGLAPKIMKRVHDEHFERKTCVVGLDWSYEIDDLLQIVEIFEGEALATICKVMAQEYGQRGGGIPDLFLWHPEEKKVKFAEVKSENDRLSDTQRLWIHVLSGAGITVELANARAKEVITR